MYLLKHVERGLSSEGEFLDAFLRPASNHANNGIPLSTTTYVALSRFKNLLLLVKVCQYSKIALTSSVLDIAHNMLIKVAGPSNKVPQSVIQNVWLDVGKYKHLVYSLSNSLIGVYGIDVVI